MLPLTSSILATGLIIAFAGAHAHASGITNDSTVASGQTFDYIIVGGGTAGTAVAARLSEDASLAILVIEVGADSRTDPDVFDIYRYSDAFGGPLDWAWTTDQGKIMRGCVTRFFWSSSAIDTRFSRAGEGHWAGARRSTVRPGLAGSQRSTTHGLRCSNLRRRL